jgi:F0F1-type ATP synthase delta subunit
VIGGGSLARRYARALLAIGQEEGQTRRILEETSRLGKPLSCAR